MQAEHIPVHLGSMPDAVAAVLGEEQRPGGSLDPQRPLPRRHPPARHHPVSPVFVDGELLGFAASRAHHADVGGPTPGGMPAFSTTPRRGGRRDPADPGRRRRAGRASPRRCACPRQRLADLRAQQAANRVGRAAAGRARRAPRRRRPARAGMEEILAYAERRTRAALAALPDGTYEAEDVLEDDSRRRRARRRPAGRGDDRRRDACGSTSPAPTPRSRATSTARSR